MPAGTRTESPTRSDGPTVLFDGVCNLCHGTVNWIIRHDKPARFRFAPLQSRAGAAIGRQYGLDPDALDTLVLVEGGKAYTKSTAALHIVRSVDSPWRVLYGLTIVPRPVRDLLYDWFARGRYRRFGKRDECMVPPPDVRERFLTEEAVRR